MKINLNCPCGVFFNHENQQPGQEWMWMHKHKENSWIEAFLKVTSSIIFEYKMHLKCPLEIVSLIQRKQKINICVCIFSGH